MHQTYIPYKTQKSSGESVRQAGTGIYITIYEKSIYIIYIRVDPIYIYKSKYIYAPRNPVNGVLIKEYIQW